MTKKAKILTPQELMDLPNYGSAEKELRKSGRWEKSALDCLNSICEDDCTDHVNVMIDSAIIKLENL